MLYVSNASKSNGASGLSSFNATNLALAVAARAATLELGDESGMIARVIGRRSPGARKLM